MIRAILFDKDGTLIDFARTYAPATRLVLMELAGGDHALAHRLAEPAGFDLDGEAFAPSSMIIAGTSHDMADAWAGLLGKADPAALVSLIDRLYLEHSRACVTPFAATKPALAALSARGLPLGIATNDSEAGARDHAGIAGIAEYFGFVAGHDSGHGRKPAPGMVLAFAETSGLAPQEIALVGDSLHDMETARAAGAMRIAVTSGMANAETLGPHSDHVLSGIGDLPALVERLAS